MKSKLWIYTIIAFGISLFLIIGTVASFETDAKAEVNTTIGKFNIKLNGYQIGTGLNQTFTVDNFIYTDNDNVESGYIAPGRSGYFDVILDVTDVDVAFRYDINISADLSNFGDNISYTVTDISTGANINYEDGSYYGIVELDDLDQESEIKLRINISWLNDATYDANDTEVGTVTDNKIVIPVNVHVIQYLGE